MQIPNIFNTPVGMYMAQSFLHALVATLVTGAAIEVWQIESPVVRQRFRLTVILLSIFSFPLYQLIDRDRSSLFFRAEALLDSSRWLELQLAGLLPLHLVLAAVFTVTSLIFVFQEMLPILRHFIVPTVEPHLAVVKPAPGSPVSKALMPLAERLPEVFIIHDDESVLFSTTFKNPAIYISAGLARKLTAEQLQAAVAHEIAHITRSKRPVLLAGFFLRTLMFFNPVVLVEFRRAIRNEEKICDDIAARITGKPYVLAQALKRFYFYEKDELPEQEEKPPSFKINLEEYSHGLQLETRIARLEHHSPARNGEDWFPFYLSLAVIVIINFYVV
jgi:Zn-dependent protease with chaperone function